MMIDWLWRLWRLWHRAWDCYWRTARRLDGNEDD
jgi:hypothetical protein